MFGLGFCLSLGVWIRAALGNGWGPGLVTAGGLAILFGVFVAEKVFKALVGSALISSGAAKCAASALRAQVELERMSARQAAQAAQAQRRELAEALEAVEADGAAPSSGQKRGRL